MFEKWKHWGSFLYLKITTNIVLVSEIIFAKTFGHIKKHIGKWRTFWYSSKMNVKNSIKIYFKINDYDITWKAILFYKFDWSSQEWFILKGLLN